MAMAASSPPPCELSNEPSPTQIGPAVDEKRRSFHHLTEPEKTLVRHVADGLKRWRADGTWTGVKDPAKKHCKRADVSGGVAALTGFARSTVTAVLAGAGGEPPAAPAPRAGCLVPDGYLFAFARDFFRKRPHLHVLDLTKAICDATGKSVSEATVWRGLCRLGFTFGRPPFPRHLLHESARVVSLRHTYLNELRKHLASNDRAVFLDESFFVVGEKSKSVWYLKSGKEFVDVGGRKGGMCP